MSDLDWSSARGRMEFDQLPGEVVLKAIKQFIERDGELSVLKSRMSKYPRILEALGAAYKDAKHRRDILTDPRRQRAFIAHYGALEKLALRRLGGKQIPIFDGDGILREVHFEPSQEGASLAPSAANAVKEVR